MFFQPNQIEMVKKVFIIYMRKIPTHQIPLNQYFFASKVRLGSCRNKNSPHPSTIGTKSEMEEDPMKVPLYGERVQYLIATYNGGQNGLIYKVLHQINF
jgi:hypothetical protein